MRTKPRTLTYFPLVALLVALALALSACGAVPANNFAGLSSDGKMLYVSDQSYLFAVDPGSGSIQWKYPQKPDQNTTFFAAPAISNGWLFAGDYNNVTFGFKLEGLDLTNPIPTWSFTTHQGKGRIIGSPLVVDGTVLVPSTDFSLYALNAADGTLKWSFKARNSLWATPASDGKLVFQAGMDHYLYALDLSTGAKKWEIDLGGPILGSAVLSKDGILYIGNMNSALVAVDTSAGKVIWKKTLEGSTWSAPLLHEGKLYFGTDKSKVYILSAPDGTVEKTVDAGGVVMATPVLTKDAVVVVTEAGEIFSLSLDGSSKVWTRKLTKGMLYSTPTILNEQIVMASFQGDHLLSGFGFNGDPDEKWNSVKP